MVRNTSVYLGDEELLALLRRAGTELTLDQLYDLVQGVVAAPTSRDRDAWVNLVAPGASRTVIEQLRLFKMQVEESYNPGFSVGSAPSNRMTKLRAELKSRDLDGFIVPRNDEHQGEYVPSRAERLRWLTGFSGSAGVAIILAEQAAIFVDGRYTLQVFEQVEASLITPIAITELSPDKWVSRHLVKGARLGYDPWLLTEITAANYREHVESAGGTLVASTDNPIDKIWMTQPAAPISPVVPHDIAYAGQSSADKRQLVANILTDAGTDAVILTLPDSIAWLLNIRGGDVAHTPLPLSFAILYSNGQANLFIDPRKLTPNVIDYLGNAVSISPPEDFSVMLQKIAKGGSIVQVDPKSAATLIFEKLEGATIVRDTDPCVLPKACKNRFEVDGARAAHKRDGCALTQFLAWFASEAPKGTLTELDAADRLAAYRYENELIQDLSFQTISGTGSNGAIVHYSVNEKSNRKIEPGQLYLVDSGAQYLDGTTDITRTIAVGTPTDEMRSCFTRVLKGHISLAMARFPEGTTGSQLDILARLPLWQVGLDFDHGTGHGVGSYLSVHEGPQSISKRANSVPFMPGMIISNEPGYYKTDAFGIRIENLVMVVPCEEFDKAERPMLELETLSLAPIDLNLVEPSLLNYDEKKWLNAYHSWVREMLINEVNTETADWLEFFTRPLKH